MKTKTLTAVITSLLLAGGATSAMAYSPADSNQGGSAFSVIDRNGDGVIDREEASASGISDSQFEEMDSNGDGRVTESEYRNFQGS